MIKHPKNLPRNRWCWSLVSFKQSHTNTRESYFSISLCCSLVHWRLYLDLQHQTQKATSHLQSLDVIEVVVMLQQRLSDSCDREGCCAVVAPTFISCSYMLIGGTIWLFHNCFVPISYTTTSRSNELNFTSELASLEVFLLFFEMWSCPDYPCCRWETTKFLAKLCPKSPSAENKLFLRWSCLFQLRWKTEEGKNIEEHVDRTKCKQLADLWPDPNRRCWNNWKYANWLLWDLQQVLSWQLPFSSKQILSTFIFQAYS